jgi:hypothetical protein
MCRDIPARELFRDKSAYARVNEYDGNALSSTKALRMLMYTRTVHTTDLQSFAYFPQEVQQSLETMGLPSCETMYLGGRRK